MRIRTALATAPLMLATAAQAQKPFTPPPPTFEGYLCCNMRSNGSWVSDINYVEGGQTVLAAGTPIKITGYGR